MRILLGLITIVLACTSLAVAAAEPDASPDCACTGEARCTIIDGIHLVSARRPVVHRLLLAKGLVPIEAEANALFDQYEAPASSPYARIDATYHERRLWALRYHYRDASIVADGYAGLDTLFGPPSLATGHFADGEDSLRRYNTPDGVTVSLERNARERGLTFAFLVRAVKDEFDAWRAGRQIEPPATAPALSTPLEKPPPGIVISPRQGMLEVRARDPVLLGTRELTLDICGEGADFESLEFFDDTKLGHFVTFHDSGAVDVKLGVHDGVDDLTYTFIGAEPGVATPSRPLGDCSSLPTATYRPTQSPRCVYIVQTQEPVRAVVERLAATSGITVDGVETLPDTPVTFDLDVTVDEALRLMSEVAEMRLERIDEGHYALRRDASPPPSK